MLSEGGCFVTKVSPDGSAARSRGVEVGDQLASINGINSTRMKVDNICDVIANSKDPSQVELVFLRYVGPFRPSRTLPSGSGYRLEPDGSLASSGKTSKSGISLWRRNPIKKNKSGGFRLFGRGKNK
jgi:PDZ domain